MPDILVYGESPKAPTGFGRVVRNIFSHLSGFNVHVFGINETDQTDYTIPDHISLQPAMSAGDVYGREKFLRYLKDPENEHDVVWLLQDHFILSDSEYGINDDVPFATEVAEICDQRGIKTVTYMPVDSAVREDWVKPLNDLDVVVAYTKWGAEKLGEHLDSKCHVINHGTNPDKFFPMDEAKVNKIKNDVAPQVSDDDFIFGYIGKNQPRKNIPRDVLYPFARFHEKHPNSCLLLKTQWRTKIGWNLPEIIDDLKSEFNLGESIAFSTPEGKPHIEDEQLNILYNMMDCLYLPSMEGWGLPVTEAYCTRTPTIVGNHAALSCVGNKDSSLRVDTLGDYNERIYLPRDGSRYRTLLDIEDCLNKFELLYKNNDERNKIKNAGYKWAMNNTWSQKAQAWKNLFLKMVNSNA